MKISQMMHFPLKGAGTGIYVDSLTKSLMRDGHQVRVLCSDHYQPVTDYPVEAVLFSDGQNEAFDLDFDFPVFASHPLSKGDKFGQLSKEELEAYFQAFRKKIEKELSEFAPDIVHVHHGWAIASILSEIDVPYIVSLHGTEYRAFGTHKNCQEFTLHGLRAAKVIIALTELERDQAIAAYDVEPQKVTVVTSGVDADLFRPVEINKEQLLEDYSVREKDRPVVVFGGRLTSQKGVATLLQAAEKYSRSQAKPITLIAGDGDLRPELESLAKELNLDSVYFLGHQSHEQMVGLLNVADVVALPSSFEPFGLVAPEALACGTPVIASRVGGLRHTVNEQVGSFIEPGDDKALAEKVITFITQGFKQKAGEAIAAYARENFRWNNTVKNIEKIYVQVLEKNR